MCDSVPLFSAWYFCASVDEVSLTSYSCPINIYIRSDVCVLFLIVNSCVPRHLPSGGGHCGLDSVDLLAVTVLKVHRLSILKPWSGGRIFPYGWAMTQTVCGPGTLGLIGDELGVVSM